MLIISFIHTLYCLLNPWVSFILWLILVNDSFCCSSFICFNNTSTSIRSFSFSYMYRNEPLSKFSQGPHTTLIRPCMDTCTGWHKKTVITKNQITSKLLFRLTQNFRYIRSSLCSRHRQSFKSVLQKLFVSLALKKCAPNDLPGAAGRFGSGGPSSRWSSRIPPLGSLLLLLWLLPAGQG